MTEHKVTSEDLEDLANKLGSVEDSLSPGQRSLLLGIVSVAADAINSGQGASPLTPLVTRLQASDAPPVSVTATEPLPAISDVFRDAFTPGAMASTGGAAAAREVTGAISIGIKF